MAITPISIAFAVFAVITLGGGLGVVSSRNLIHAALYLVLSLFGISGLYVLLEAPFLAVIQVLVYMGAIAVLVTITIMVTRRIMGITEASNKAWPLSAAAAALLAGVLGFVMVNAFGGAYPVAAAPPDMVEQLGFAFVSHQAYLLPFEVASVLLLGAMIGAIVVSRD